MRLIDADALEKRMEERLNALRKEYGNYDHYTDGFEEGCIAVEDAETIETVPTRLGRWIDGADSFGAKRGTYRVCSFCNICIPRTKEVPDGYWQCCPNCMTKMKK